MLCCPERTIRLGPFFLLNASGLLGLCANQLVILSEEFFLLPYGLGALRALVLKLLLALPAHSSLHEPE